MENITLIKKLLNYPMYADVVITFSESEQKELLTIIVDASDDEKNDSIYLGEP